MTDYWACIDKSLGPIKVVQSSSVCREVSIVIQQLPRYEYNFPSFACDFGNIDFLCRKGLNLERPAIRSTHILHRSFREVWTYSSMDNVPVVFILFAEN